ncbi:MAG: hypothetical protein P8X88_10000 [Gammaproteobacteria bacterium]
MIVLPAMSALGFGGGKGNVSGNFWGADLDRNEQLNTDEAKAVYNLADKEVFDHYDKNKNGSINFTEYSMTSLCLTKLLNERYWPKTGIN